MVGFCDKREGRREKKAGTQEKVDGERGRERGGKMDREKEEKKERAYMARHVEFVDEIHRKI